MLSDREPTEGRRPARGGWELLDEKLKKAPELLDDGMRDKRSAGSSHRLDRTPLRERSDRSPPRTKWSAEQRLQDLRERNEMNRMKPVTVTDKVHFDCSTTPIYYTKNLYPKPLNHLISLNPDPESNEYYH